MRLRTITVLLGLLIAGLLAWMVMRRDDVGKTRRLPDGSTLQLLEVAFTATNHNYEYKKWNRLTRLLVPIVPAKIRNRFSGSGKGVGWSGLESTNLIAITLYRSGVKDGKCLVERFRLLDDRGNTYDPSWGAPSAGGSEERLHGWRAYAFPHRERVIGLQFLATTQAGGWTNVAEFRIPNPLYGTYPQWQPEPWPISKQADALTVTLKEFQTRSQMTGTNLSDMARTRIVCSFGENGDVSENWRIQKLTISDATGNRWSPYLNFTGRNSWNWATNGTVEFFGALWPGEQAWKLRVEVMRTGGFEPAQLWDVKVPLPPSNIVTALTNNWEHAGLAVKLVSVASPETDHFGDFKSIAKWWGEQKNKTYSLALTAGPKQHGSRLSAVHCVDQNNREVEIVVQGSPDSDKQAVFFKPGEGATEARFTFAVQRNRFVEFLARPEFDSYSIRERDVSKTISP